MEANNGFCIGVKYHLMEVFIMAVVNAAHSQGLKNDLELLW